jgi:diguanylate cyclase (GGDEF)-like protein
MSGNTADELARDYESLHRNYLALLRQVDHLSTLREIALAINSTLDINETLPLIANVVQGALDVSKLTIFQFDEDGLAARPVIAKYGRDLIGKDRLDEESAIVRGTPLGQVAESRSVVLVCDDLHNAAYIPLVAKNALLGILRIEDPRDGVPFREEDASLFQSLGAQIALAINNAQLYAMAVMDGLTQLYVRRYFDLRMDEEFDQARRYRRSFSLLLFDIDHFKRFNDTHGHQTGDMVLQQVAKLIQNNTRSADICCRYGGEEMAVILPETQIREAAVLANKLCGRIRDHAFRGTEDGARLAVTVSIGVSEYLEGMKEPGEMVAAADSVLYRAKDAGRDRVEVAGE